ncbi:MAG: NYN domain-containing protein [Acidobacteriota bacterium]|nr:NYN domain-containing protein [Acidobacteriota bacterium]
MALPQPSVTQLRSVLTRALELARSAPPGHPLPGAVRGLVRGRRLPVTWEVTLRRALEDDEGFRQWVAEAASQEEIGRLGWLWLHRPDGWSEAVAELMDADAEDKEVLRLAARVADLEASLAEAHSAAASAVAAGEDRAVLHSNRLAEAQQELARSQAEARREASRHDREATRLRARVAALEQAAVEAEAKGERLEARAALLTEELARARSRAAEMEGRAQRAEGRVGVLEAEKRTAAEALSRSRSAEQSIRAAAAAAVSRAAATAADLAAVLAEVGANLHPPGPTSPGAAAPAPPAASGNPAVKPGRVRSGSIGSSGAARAAGAGREGEGRRRAPEPALSLPLGVTADSPEAAAHLIRADGVHLIVDGYNVALRSWASGTDGLPAGADLADLRQRLVDALSELALRSRVGISVIFDGDQASRVSAPGPARPWLQIVFSASGVEADQVILDMVAARRPHGPVLVATDDRAVQEAAGRRGANILSSVQTLGLLNRHTPLG